MTSKEALDGFKRHMETYHRHPVKSILDNEIKILEKLVERDTPKEVEYDDMDNRCCPICEEVQLPNIYATNNEFCSYCGQKIDWSEE